MGFDVFVALLYGYKIRLSDAFERGLLSPDIMTSDEWQLFDDDDCKKDVLEFVSDQKLKVLLDAGEWKGYILSSTQEQCDVENSFFYLYNKKVVLHNGQVPDYMEGIISTVTPESKVLDYGQYDIHWVISGSW